LKKAKENVEKRYAVVGVLEDFNKTLSVLGANIPQFFRGVSAIYEGKLYYLTLAFRNDNRA
jgi:hypothetical protein